MRFFLVFAAGAQFLGSVDSSKLPLDRGVKRATNTNTTSPLVSAQYGSAFLVNTTIGGQRFELDIEFGRGDVAVLQTGFQCHGDNEDSGGWSWRVDNSQNYCNHSVTYHESTTYQRIPNMTYLGNGNFGLMGRDDITLGGITVKKQTFGLINKSWLLNGGGSGTLGLGFIGNELNESTRLPNPQTYDPLFMNMYQQHLIKPYFSLALDRLPQNVSRGPGGYLTLGDLPPVALGSNFTVAPLEISQELREKTDLNLTRTSWLLSVNGVTFGDSSNSTSFQAVVASRTALSHLPQAVADQVNARFKPAATWNETHQRYHVNCAAKPPSFGIRIGNETFFHDPADLIQRTQGGFCVSTITRPAIERPVYQGGANLSFNFLGVPFLKNVVSVFDLERKEMKFAKRVNDDADSAGGMLKPGLAGWSVSTMVMALLGFALHCV